MSVPLTTPPVPYQRLRQELARRRLPRYHGVARRLNEYRSQGHITHLWREVFAAEPPPGSAFDAQVDFVGRVCQELFPVDTAAMDDLLNSGGDPLQHSIMIAGWGVPWEIEGFLGVGEADQPLVAMVYTAGADRYAPVLDYCREDLFLEGPIADWWADHGFDQATSDRGDRLALRLRPSTPRPLDKPVLSEVAGLGTTQARDDASSGHRSGLAWAANPERAWQLLRGLEPPLDGLATLYRCVVKGTGNPFYDLPGGMVQGEYLMNGDFDYYWDPGDVRALAQYYAAVRDDVTCLDRYYDWFEDTPGAERRVVETLTRLEDANYDD